MINEQADADFMPVLIFTEGQGFAHQIGTPLAERVVEAFNMGRLATFFAHWTMPFGWQHLGVGPPEVTVTDRSLAIIGRE